MILIGQTLHGYEDGHSLLASSEDLPYDAESTLFVLSDLSGQSFVEGFETYLTGYPLTGMHSFAFARTWYAPEMERPGCVWTHTLLIKFGDLARLSDLNSLLDLFLRPTRQGGPWTKYEKKLAITESPILGKKLDGMSRSKLAAICDALYSDDVAPVLIPTLKEAMFEELFIRLWSQQWPRLRRNFTFCTGAIEGRELGGRSFDLQCIPSKYLSLGGSLPANPIIVNGLPRDPQLPMVVLSTIAEDIEHPNDLLRDFTRSYGADAPGNRTTFAAFVSIWLLLARGITSEEAFVNALEAIRGQFPSPDEVSKLKAELLLSNEVGGTNITLSLEQRIMSVIALEREPATFAESFKVDDYINRIVETSPASVVHALEKLVRTRSLNALGQKFISAASYKLDWEMLQSEASPELLMVMVGTNPTLIEKSGLWKKLRGRAYELIDIFASRISTADEWSVLCRAVIENDVAQAAPMLFERGGAAIATSALEYFEDVNVYRDSFTSWYVELEKRQPLVIEWLSGRTEISTVNMLGLSLVLDPFFDRASMLGSLIWRGVEDDNNARRLAFALVVSSQDRSQAAAKIFSVCFRKLHRLVNGEQLEFYSWRILQDVLPHIWKDWDVGERLRRYFCSTFARNGWNFQDFWGGLEGREVVHEVFDFIASEKDLREFGRALIKSADSYSLPQWQYETVPSLPKKLRKF